MRFAPDVVVAGAGPVGLVAALSLAQEDVKVLVLEKREALSAASLASTIHPPTLSILNRLGVLREVIPEGLRVDTIQYRTPDGVFAEFAMPALAGETEFPFRLHLEQARITPVLLERLRALPNARVAFNRPVVGVEAGEDGIAVDLPGARIEARNLLAADGARSTVREDLGIAFPGQDYPDQILRLITTDDLDAILPGIAPVTYLYNGARSISFLRMPGCWRIILRVPGDVGDAQAMAPAWILERFQAVLPELRRLPEIVGMDVYRASRRVADRVQVGRAVLLGDAAHVTSTRGGMNMNCGIHDAAALAAAIASGADLAATAAERARVAREMLIPRTDRTVSGGAEWAARLRETAQSPGASLAYLRQAAMLDMAHV